jgi:hypothetical protein
VFSGFPAGSSIENYNPIFVQGSPYFRDCSSRLTADQSVRENYSFAPLGLAPLPLFTQGLRPGLHSFAASRLKPGPSFHCGDVHCSSHAHSISPVFLNQFLNACSSEDAVCEECASLANQGRQSLEEQRNPERVYGYLFTSAFAVIIRV